MLLSLAMSQAVERLKVTTRGNYRLDAETLLMHVLGRERAYLYAHPDLVLSCSELSRYHEYLERRAVGEPIQYITGHQEFWRLDLLVTPAVLIPRPETEHAVEAALELARNLESPRIVDVGTGSGCIALALASELPHAQVEATDISAEALAIAKINAERLGLPITLAQGDLLENLLSRGPVFDLIISNPPYVGESEADKLQREVRDHEPHSALFGGVQGLDIFRRLAPQAHEVLRPGGWLVLEIGYSQEASVRELLQGWNEIRSVTDLQGIPRVVVARK
jgi:protein-(glutamine-N5) methyltransferase, release factor-specific